MHELGVVFKVIDHVQEVAKENNVEHVNAVVLEIGTVSGIVELYLRDVWHWAVEKHENMKGCHLRVEYIEAITYCEDCHQQYDTIKYAKVCPHCGSEHTFLLQGNEFNIKEIEVY